jgi:hypothetical protein
MRYFKAIEHLFSMFMDTEEIRIIKDAIGLMQSETFSVPNITWKASVCGAFACGVNVYLATHMLMLITPIQLPLFIGGVYVIMMIKSCVTLPFQDLVLPSLFVQVMYCFLIQMNLIVSVLIFRMRMTSTVCHCT